MSIDTLTYRMAQDSDAKLYFNWINDSEVRKSSFNQTPVTWDEHLSWFRNKLCNDSSLLLVYFIRSEPIGQLRIDFNNRGEGEIDYSVDANHRRQSLGSHMLLSAYKLVKVINSNLTLVGLVKKENYASCCSFEKAGFKCLDELKHESDTCRLFVIKTND